jgi:hypothetical protein
MDNEEIQLAVWRLFLQRTTLEAARRDAHERDDKTAARAAEASLASLPEIDVKEALKANADLIARLSSQRWIGMKVARDQGIKMEEIGEQLGVSKQAAWEFLKRKIEENGGEIPPGADDSPKGAWNGFLDRFGFTQATISDEAWVSFLALYSEGDTVTCTVVRRTLVGAAVEIEGGMPAFLLSFPPGSAPEVGETLKVRIAGFDEKARRVGLMRLTTPQKDAHIEAVLKGKAAKKAR